MISKDSGEWIPNEDRTFQRGKNTSLKARKAPGRQPLELLCVYDPPHTTTTTKKKNTRMFRKKFLRKGNCEPQHVVSKRGKRGTLFRVRCEPPTICYKIFDALYAVDE